MSLRDKIVKEKVVCYNCYTYLNSSVHANGKCKFKIISNTFTKDDGAFANITVMQKSTLLGVGGNGKPNADKIQKGISMNRSRQRAWLKLFGDKI